MGSCLLKADPEDRSINGLENLGKARWDGVRDYQARNSLRAMAGGDELFFYHSSCPEPGIAGIGKIIEAAYPDPTALEPESHYFDAKASAEKNPWSAINVAHVKTFPKVLSLGYLKQQAALAELPLVQKGSRLSVMAVTPEQWAAVINLL
ncbi:EVE domain-containing protein [Corynebacterium propinquum]|nr:EVE domain-containing protein [Corynebacterium propinquum]